MEMKTRQKIRTLGYISPLVIVLGFGIYYVNGIWDFLSIGVMALGVVLAIIYVLACGDELKKLFSQRSFRSGTNFLLITCLVAAVVVLANVAGYRDYIRKDITVAKKFTLSPITENIFNQLETKDLDVYITCFYWTNIDRSLSEQQNQMLIRMNREREKKMRDLLAVYESMSPKISYRFIDPNRDLMLARQYNIQLYRDNVAVVECGDHIEMVPDMDSEERLTNAIIKVVSGDIYKVYFLQGHQEKDIADGGRDGYLTAASSIEDQSYQVAPLNILETGGVPDDCRALVIAGPRKDLLPAEIRLVDDYLERGGRVMVLLDPEYQTSLNEWLLNWGIRIGDNMVVDNSASGLRQGAGPTEPLISSYDEDSPITRQLMKAFSTLPTVRSVSIVNQPPEGLDLTILAKTSDNSWGETEISNTKLRNPTFDPSDMSGPVPVAVSMLKKLEEMKPGIQELYKGPGGKTPTQEEIKQQQLDKSQTMAEIVVFGDSQFASNSYFRYGGNRDFFMNSISWLIGDERLISIRPQDPEDQTLYLTQRQARRMGLVVQFALPLLVLLIGLFVWVLRRNNRL